MQKSPDYNYLVCNIRFANQIQCWFVIWYQIDKNCAYDLKTTKFIMHQFNTKDHQLLVDYMRFSQTNCKICN